MSWVRDPNLSKKVSVCSECCEALCECECVKVDLRDLGITYEPDSGEEWLARLSVAQEDEMLIRGIELTDERVVGEDPEGEEVLREWEKDRMGTPECVRVPDVLVSSESETCPDMITVCDE